MSDETTSDATIPDPKRPSVLLVEDDPDTQSDLARALSESGARVVGTGSGEAAIALMAEWPAGVVVVSDTIGGAGRDGRGGMGGLEVVRRIHESRPGVPIVLMSERADGKDGEAKAIAARLAGVFATLTRPFDRRLLAELVVAVAVASDVVIG